MFDILSARWPFRRGYLSGVGPDTQYASKEELFHDIAALFEEGLARCGLSRKGLRQMKVLIVIPDIYDKKEVRTHASRWSLLEAHLGSYDNIFFKALDLVQICSNLGFCGFTMFQESVCTSAGENTQSVRRLSCRRTRRILGRPILSSVSPLGIIFRSHSSSLF